MPKLKRQRQRQKFNYSTNRKRVKNRMEKNTKFNIKVDCPILRENWDNRKSVKQNMDKLGVAVDANNSVKQIKSTKTKFTETPLEALSGMKTSKQNKAPTATVSKLVAEAAIVKPPTFRFSLEQVKWITSMLDKYNDYDFKAMARDPKNVFQETPKQIEKKVRKFMKIPDHYVPYCREKGLLNSEKESSDVKMSDTKC